MQLGYSVRFVTAQALANDLVAAPNRSAVTALLQPLMRCDLLILDEFGYLPVDPQIGPALYELVAARYERLLHRGEVFYLRGASYRMRGKEALLMGKLGSEGGQVETPVG